MDPNFASDGSPDRAAVSFQAASTGASITATIVGSFLVRLGGAATGVMLGFLLAHLHRAGESGTSALAASLVAGAFYVSELFGAPLAGMLIDRRGVRALLLAGPILGIVAEVLFAGPTHLAGLTVARLLQGLTTACTIPAALAFLSEATIAQAGRGRIMGFFEVGSIGGLAAGYVAGGFLWAGARRDGFVYLSLLYTLAVALFVVVRIDHLPRLGRPRMASWRAIRSAADLVPSWLALTAAAGVWFGQAAYQLSGANPRLNQLLTVGLGEKTIGIIFGLYTLLFALGTVGWGWSIERVGLVRAMRIGVVGLLLAAAAILGVNHAPAFSGPLYLGSLVLGVVSLALETAYTPAALTMLAMRSDAERHGRGAVMGVYSMLLAGGQLLGAIVGGVFAMRWGVDGLIFATALLGVFAALTLPGEVTSNE